VGRDGVQQEPGAADRGRSESTVAEGGAGGGAGEGVATVFCRAATRLETTAPTSPSRPRPDTSPYRLSTVFAESWTFFPNHILRRRGGRRVSEGRLQRRGVTPHPASSLSHLLPAREGNVCGAGWRIKHPGVGVCVSRSSVRETHETDILDLHFRHCPEAMFSFDVRPLGVYSPASCPSATAFTAGNTDAAALWLRLWLFRLNAFGVSLESVLYATRSAPLKPNGVHPMAWYRICA
jgi:hypothetical protein